MNLEVTQSNAIVESMLCAALVQAAHDRRVAITLSPDGIIVHDRDGSALTTRPVGLGLASVLLDTL